MTKGEGAVKHYFWGAISTTIILVLLYLIAPLSGRVSLNNNTIIRHETRITVMENKIQEGFTRIEKKLDKIDLRLNE